MPHRGTLWVATYLFLSLGWETTNLTPSSTPPLLPWFAVLGTSWWCFLSYKIVLLRRKLISSRHGPSEAGDGPLQVQTPTCITIVIAASCGAFAEIVTVPITDWKPSRVALNL